MSSHSGFAGRHLKVWQALAVCAAAGFRGPALTTAVAVAWAESGLWTGAWHTNYPGEQTESTDRGLWQINDRFHPNCTDEEAYNPYKASKYAYQLSLGGEDFTPWMAYGGSRYLAFRVIVAATRLTTRRWRRHVDTIRAEL